VGKKTGEGVKVTGDINESGESLIAKRGRKEAGKTTHKNAMSKNKLWVKTVLKRSIGEGNF